MDIGQLFCEIDDFFDFEKQQVSEPLQINYFGFLVFS